MGKSDECSSLDSSTFGFAGGITMEMGVVEAGPEPPCVNTKPVGAGVTEDAGGPLGAESILPKPMRTGAVSDRAGT